MNHTYSLTALRRALSPSQRSTLRAAEAEAEAMGRELWVVGGAVRDMGRGASPVDLDLAVDGDAERLANRIAARLGGTARVESHFMTATVTTDHDADAPHALNIATLRTEQYAHPGALPAVRPGATIETDLARRDFTVNAIALGLTGPRRGQIVDPFGGIEDLAAGRLRFLHPDSVRDDPTRQWRAARYATRLDLAPDAEAESQLRDGTQWVASISGERLWAEFERVAAERRVLLTLRLLDEWGVLAAIAPGWCIDPRAEAALRRRAGPHPPELLLAVLLASLPSAVGDAVIARLRPPLGAGDVTRWTMRLLEAGPQADRDTPEVLERFAVAPEPILRQALLAASWIDPEGQAGFATAIGKWRRTAPALDGHALLALGVPRGPRLGAWLRRLRRERYLGNLRTTTEARAATLRWLREEPPDAQD